MDQDFISYNGYDILSQPRSRDRTAHCRDFAVAVHETPIPLFTRLICISDEVVAIMRLADDAIQPFLLQQGVHHIKRMIDLGLVGRTPNDAERLIDSQDRLLTTLDDAALRGWEELDLPWYVVTGLEPGIAAAKRLNVVTNGPFESESEAREKVPVAPGQWFVQAKSAEAAIREAYRRAGIPYP